MILVRIYLVSAEGRLFMQHERVGLAGQICCNCKTFLPPPHTGRETYCLRCSPKLKVYTPRQPVHDGRDIRHLFDGTYFVKTLAFSKQGTDKLTQCSRILYRLL